MAEDNTEHDFYMMDCNRGLYPLFINPVDSKEFEDYMRSITGRIPEKTELYYKYFMIYQGKYLPFIDCFDGWIFNKFV